MKKKLYIKTPLYKSHLIDESEVYYKMDCYQPTGSFKIRGMDNLCRYHINKGNTNFIGSSGGNAGYSLAYVGREMGASVKIVVPETTPTEMVNKIKSVGASVEIYGNVWDEAHDYATKISLEKNYVYVSPFDDPLLWEGHSSLIDECANEMEQPDKIVLAVGGGGLFCGVVEGMIRNNWQHTEIITTETNGTSSFYQSYNSNKLIELDEISSVATSLGAKRIAKKALELAQKMKVTSIRMTDEIAIKSTLGFLKEYNTLVEPACGTALAYPYHHSSMINKGERVLVIICGGVNTSLKYFSGTD